MTLPSHLFVASSDGALYDTRVPNWHTLAPLRANYQGSRRRIKSIADLKATLRAGPYAWPGGYPMYLLTSDGEAMSFASVRDNLRKVTCKGTFADPSIMLGFFLGHNFVSEIECDRVVFNKGAAMGRVTLPFMCDINRNGSMRFGPWLATA